MLAFTTGEETELKRAKVGSARTMRASGSPVRSGVHIRLMNDLDLERILELRKTVRWAADPQAFDLLRGMRGPLWAIAEVEGALGAIVGMVGAVPLGKIGILCHLAVHHDYRKMGLGVKLSSWAVSYLHSQGAKVVRLDSTHQAENLYRSLGFEPTSRRATYRLEGAALKETSRYLAGRSAQEGGGLQITPLVFGDLPELYGVDRWSFGGDRSALILATLKLPPGWGLVARDGSGRIKGYLIRSALGLRTRIGPFMAAEPDVARCLLSRALQMNGSSSFEVSVTAASPAYEVLREFGFTGRVDRLRMELGDLPSTKGLEAYGTTPYLAT